MKNINRLVYAGIAILFCLISYMPLNAQGYSIGDEAEDFSLLNIDGKQVSLADYPDARGYIVVFTCNHCPFAKMYEERLIALNDKYEPEGYPVIAINPNDPEVQPQDSYDKMITRAAEKGFTFPYLMDEGQTVYPKFGATKTPHVFLLDSDLRVKYIGAIDNNHQDPDAVSEKYVENAIAAMENGSAIDPTTTKAIGCGIKKKK